MADYYPLIARAVAGLEKSTGEARRALYERARTALVTQLRGVVPALSESDITRERLALEESIRKVEAEAARRSRVDPPAAKAPAPPPAEPPRREERAAAPPPPPPQQPRKESPAEPAAMPSPPPRMPRPRPPEHSTSLTDEGLKGFRDVVAESDELGGAAAQASRAAREAFNAVPSPSGEFERQEPRLEPEGLRPPSRERPARDPAREARDALRETRREQNRETERGYVPEDEYSDQQEMLEPAINVPESRPSPPGAKTGRPTPPPPRPAARMAEPEDERPKLPRRSYAGLIVVLLLLLAAGGLAALGYWNRDMVVATYQSMFSKSASKPPAARDPNAAQQRPKIADRIEPNGQNPSGSPTPAAQVAQRAVLYEEDPNDPQGKRFQGSVVWRTESVPAGPGQPAELAVRADVELPERRITMTFSLRRNTDQALPASHTVEVMFNLPADFPGGGISNVPGVLMKQAEATRGVPLAGLAVKVTTGFFLIGLSAVEADVQRNMALLKERSWFDIPVVYNNGTRAILAIEKGTPGERAFEAAFKSWGAK